jgi:hypothetical protein
LKGSSNQNVLPFPGVLFKPICPPIISTSCFEMVVPSPVPPYRRVVVSSAWTKLSKMRS